MFIVSVYLLLGLLIVRSAKFGSLLGGVLWFIWNCTGPGGFETETLGMALLLLPDPVGLGACHFPG